MQRRRPALRAMIVAIAAAEVLLGLAFIAFMLQASDPLGKSIDRLNAALALALIAVPAVLVLWGMA